MVRVEKHVGKGIAYLVGTAKRIPEDNSGESGDSKTGYKFRLQYSLSQQMLDQ